MSVNQTKLDQLMDLVGELVTTESMVASNPDLRARCDKFHFLAQLLAHIPHEARHLLEHARKRDHPDRPAPAAAAPVQQAEKPQQAPPPKQPAQQPAGTTPGLPKAKQSLVSVNQTKLDQLMERTRRSPRFR